MRAFLGNNISMTDIWRAKFEQGFRLTCCPNHRSIPLEGMFMFFPER